MSGKAKTVRKPRAVGRPANPGKPPPLPGGGDALIRSIWHSSPIAIELYDANGLLVDANPACLALFGIESLDEVKGFKLFEDPNLSARHKQLLARGQTVQYEVAFDFNLVRKLNLYRTARREEVIHLSVLIAPLRDNGEPDGFLVQLQETTAREEANRDLQESRENYRRLAEDMPAYISVFAPDGTLTYVNPALAAITGMTLAEITGRNFFQMLSPEERSAIQERLRALTPAQPTETHEQSHRTPDGGLSWQQWTNRAFFDEHGRPTHFQAVGLDITARKQAEIELQRKSEQLDRYFTQSLDLLCIADTGGHFLRLNPEWEKVLGYPVAELAGRRFLDFVHPDDMEATLAALATLGKQGEVLGFVNRYRCRDGSYRWIEWRSSPQGEMIYAVARDITVQKQVERALMESEEKYRALFDKAADAILIVDAEGRILAVNDAMCAQYGYTRAELLSMPVAMLDTPEQAVHVPARIRELQERGSLHFETRHLHKGGQALAVDVMAKWINWEGLPGIMAICRNLSMQKRMEQALRESESNFRAFFETIGDMIVVAAPDGRILFSNRIIESKLGYSAAELAGMHVLDLHPPDRRREAEEIFAAMFRRERESCPLPVAAKDGAAVPVETRAWAGRWNGEDCIFGLIKDLSAELEAQQKFERLFRHNPALMALTTLPERRFSDVNDAFLKALGYERGEVIGRTTAELGLFPDQRQQDELARRLGEDGRITDYELQVRIKDGSLLSGLFSGEVIVSQGRRHFLTVMIDITERKRMEEGLRGTLQRNRLQMKCVAEISAAAALKGSDVQSFFAHLTEETAAISGVERVGLWLMNEAQSELRCVDLFESSPRRHSAGAVLARAQFENEFAALLAAKYVDAHDALTDPRTAGYVETYLKPLRITSMLDALVRNGETVFGVLCLEHVDTPHRWEMDEINFVCQLADQIAIAILNAEQRRAQESLRQSRESLRRMNERMSLAAASTGIGVWDWDVVNDVLIWDDQMVRLYGIRREEFSGAYEAWTRGLHPDDKAFASAEIEAALRGDREFDIEFRVIWPDRSTRYLKGAALTVRDGSGRPLRMVGINYDITDRKLAAIALEDERNRLRQALEEVKTLRGIIPICASCKRIRSDEGFWSQVEVYVSRHTEAQFSHGLCPACVEKFKAEIP